MDHKVFDTIELKDGRKFTGIIDYVSTKQVYFFDFTKETNEDYILLALLWKGNETALRFSVFCSINYPFLNLPNAVLLPIANVDATTKEIKKSKKPKQQKTLIRIAETVVPLDTPCLSE